MTLCRQTEVSVEVIQTMAVVPEQVSVAAALALILSELENIPSLKEEQRMKLKAFLDGKNDFTLLTVLGKSLIYHEAPLVMFVDLIDKS